MTVHGRLEYQPVKGEKIHTDSSEAFRSELISDPNRTGRTGPLPYDAASFNNGRMPLYDAHKLYGGTADGAPKAQEAAAKKDNCAPTTEADVDNEKDFWKRQDVVMAYHSQKFVEKLGATEWMKKIVGCDKKD